jgi:hypothetical protein
MLVLWMGFGARIWGFGIWLGFIGKNPLIGVPGRIDFVFGYMIFGSKDDGVDVGNARQGEELGRKSVSGCDTDFPSKYESNYAVNVSHSMR